MSTSTVPDTDTIVTIGGQPLHFTEWNPTAGDATLLIHGINRELHIWDPVVPSLAENRRVICVDLRGHGRSGWSDEGYALESFAGDLGGLLNHLGLTEVKIIGHSLGARIGICLAATWSGTTRHLVLSDTGAEFPKKVALALSEANRKRGYYYFDSEGDALTKLRAANPEWADEFHVNSVRHEFRTNWIGKVVRRSDPELRWMVQTEWVEGNPRLWAWWSSLRMPVTLLWGSDSGFLDEEIVGRMRRDQPGLVVRRPAGSHYYLRESPEEFVRLAEEALAADLGTSGRSST